MKKLITLILLSIAFISCDDDPVSLDDKKVITDFGGKNIVYTYYKEIDNGKSFEMGVSIYNLKTKKIINIDNEYSQVNSPIIDNKILISKAAEDKSIAIHYLYDLVTGDTTHPYDNRLAKFSIRRNENSNRLLLSEDVFEGQGPLFTSGLDGRNIIHIDNILYRFIPMLSNTGNKLYYHDIDNNIIVANNDGSNKQTLDLYRSNTLDWHPIENKILCVRYISSENRNEFFVYNLDNNLAESIINLEPIVVRKLKYSPDGKKVLVVDYGWSLYLYDVEKKKVSLIRRTENESGRIYFTNYISWSSDGRYVIFRNPKFPDAANIEKGKVQIIDTETLTVEDTEIPDEAMSTYWYENE